MNFKYLIKRGHYLADTYLQGLVDSGVASTGFISFNGKDYFAKFDLVDTTVLRRIDARLTGYFEGTRVEPKKMPKTHRVTKAKA